MTLIEQLTLRSSDAAIEPINPWVYMACMMDYLMGHLSGPQIISALKLDAAAAVEAGQIKNAIVAGNSALHGTSIFERFSETKEVLLLAQAAVPGYTSIALVRARLGLP